MNKLIYLLAFALIVSCYSAAAIIETANISSVYGTTASQATEKGMIFNISGNINQLYRIENVTKYPSTTATQARLCYDIHCDYVISTASFSGNLATFSGANLFPGEYFLLTEESTITHSYNDSATVVYPTPGSNTYIKFTRGINDGAVSTTTYYNFNSITVSILASNISKYTYYYNASTYETATESISVNVELNQSTTQQVNSAKLHYNGTAYSASLTAHSTKNYTLSKSVVVPLQTEAIAFTWELFFTDGSRQNLSTKIQASQDIILTICNSTFNVTYMNITFKNETIANEEIRATLSSTATYSLTSGSATEYYSFSNISENLNYNFCFYPNTRGVYINFTAQYSNAESQQRDQGFNALLTNITTNKVFYLLPTLLGQYVVFQVTNIADQVVPGANIEINHTTLGSIGSRTTDSAGTATFFLNPLSTYYVTTSAAGYSQLISTLVPSSTSYTIQLDTDVPATSPDCSRGISYSIGPSLSTILENNLDYPFNFTLSSTYWNLDSFGFSIKNSSDTLGSNSSSTISGGFLSLYINSTSSHSLRIDYFWEINNSFCNSTAYWTVDLIEDDDWSIAYFLSDLDRYLESGMFGLSTSFGVPILIFFVIFIFVGVMSYKFGLNSPATIALIILGLVALFDVGFGMLDNITPIGAVTNFPTIIMTIIFVALLLREVSR